MNRRRFLARAFVLAFSFAPGFACKHDPTPADVKNVVDVGGAGCKLIEAVTGDGAVKTICAVVQEIDRLIDLVFAEKSDAAALTANAGKCVRVVGTGGREACASVEQVSRWIDDTNRRRAALFIRDAGRD